MFEEILRGGRIIQTGSRSLGLRIKILRSLFNLTITNLLRICKGCLKGSFQKGEGEEKKR